MRVTFDTVYDLKFGVNAVIVIHCLHKIDLVMRISAMMDSSILLSKWCTTVTVGGGGILESASAPKLSFPGIEMV